MSEIEDPWWRSAVIYQVYPRSFQDSDGDGVGDLPGLRARLGELVELGVDALWLSPMHPSPQRDFGYDISDYRGVDPLFGSLADLEALIADAHRRGLKVILDGVFNHTSDEHPWFEESRASPENPKRGWYLWHRGDRPPCNWASVFGGSGWSRDEMCGDWYFHSFARSQPDLNWRNEEVVEAVLGAMEYWLDLGVDGFRLDVFNCYFKDDQRRSNPRRFDPLGLLGGLAFPYIGQHHIFDRDRPEMVEALGRMRALIDAKPGRVLIGETLCERLRYDNAARYCGAGKLHMAFNFRLLHSRFSARSFGAAIRHQLGALPADGWPSWVLSNHDVKRHASRWGRRAPEARARLAALMLLTMKGTPCLYYGEEIGLREARIPRSRIVDPPGRRFWPFYRGRDGCRGPMPWEPGRGAGFTEGEPWLPLPDDQASRNVATQRADAGSMLALYRSLIALRRSERALSSGLMRLPERDHPSVLCYLREACSRRLLVALNMSPREQLFEPPFAGELGACLASTAWPRRSLEEPRRLRLAPHEGVVMVLGEMPALQSPGTQQA